MIADFSLCIGMLNERNATKVKISVIGIGFSKHSKSQFWRTTYGFLIASSLRQQLYKHNKHYNSGI